MRFLRCLLALCSLSACKSSSLTPINSGSDPKWTGVNTYEVLVAVQAYTPETRLLFERDLAIALKKESIRAVPSYTVYPNIALLNGDTFSKFLAADPRLAVLFIQAKNVSRQQTNTNKEGRKYAIFKFNAWWGLGYDVCGSTGKRALRTRSNGCGLVESC